MTKIRENTRKDFFLYYISYFYVHILLRKIKFSTIYKRTKGEHDREGGREIVGESEKAEAKGDVKQ